MSLRLYFPRSGLLLAIVLHHFQFQFQVDPCALSDSRSYPVDQIQDVVSCCSASVYDEVSMLSRYLSAAYPFSFEAALVSAGLPVRNLDEGKNVSMYVTNRDCRPAGPFSAPLVVTMRPMRPEEAVRAVQVTTRFHLTHGAPIHMGSPVELGIEDLNRPDFGDAVTIRDGEIPVFWACGVTSGLAATSIPLPLVITHAPGHMFVSDLRDEHLTLL